MRNSETPEVAPAAEARPLGENGQGDDLRVGEQADRLSVASGGGLASTSRLRARTMRPRRTPDSLCGTILWREFSEA